MTARYIWHVALGAGMGTRETREHLSDERLALYRAHLDRSFRDPDPIPDRPDYRLAGREISGVLLCTVGHMPSQDSLCTFSVVTKSQYRAKAWVALHEGYPQYADSRGDVPLTPYCAVRGEWGLIRHISAGEWLDAYQVAVAWAWMEQR